MTAILPETLAAIVAYVNAPVAKEGLYGIIVVGAGTTDISFFRLSFSGADKRPRAAFYYAQTTPVGAYLVDREVLNILGIRATAVPDQGAEQSRKLQVIRLAKEALSQQSSVRLTDLDGCPVLTRQQLDQAATVLADQVAAAHAKTWQGAYTKESRLSNWRDLQLFHAGGGARLSLVQDELRRSLHPHLPAPSVNRIYLGDIQGVLGASGLSRETDEADLLVVAYGLSFPKVDFPEFFPPGSVRPFQPRPPEGKPITPEDLGYSEK
ncbi:MAG: hypothetical protein ACE5G5_11565 [Candidatus Methylomirabilales bacterium]